MELKTLLVVVPHSGLRVPAEISPDSLTCDFPQLARNIDWYTDWLYDFRDILNNTHLEFPYCSLILEANRHPQNIDECVPLRDVAGEPVYRHGQEPDEKLREMLARKYLDKFHQVISEQICRGKAFLLDGHSTVTARGVAANQIELMNYQVSSEGELTCFCPDVFIETYASELVKLLPGVKITVNQSKYHQVYGHICGMHSVNSMERTGRRVPAILQETNQNLYINPNGEVDIVALEKLRRSFAEALYRMMKIVNS